MYRQVILFSILFLAAACSSGISVQNQYFSREDLASYKVGTPDPDRNCPPIGQRLLVQWRFTPDVMARGSLELVMTVRLRNYNEERIVIPVRCSRGSYIYELANERYFNSCGVATYKIETVSCGEVIHVWKHQLWCELITIDQENDTIDDEQIKFIDE